MSLAQGEAWEKHHPVMAEKKHSTLPNTTAERKAIPLAAGVLDYFPAALAYVARISKAGNDKHNPGQPLHHARGKSMDHPDCILRHLIDRGTIDPEDGLRHSGKVAWRALALLQEELEREEGAPLARAARLPEPELVPPAVQAFVEQVIPRPLVDHFENLRHTALPIR